MPNARAALRVAVLQRGRILDERTFAPGARVHVGPGGELAQVPGSRELFRSRHGRPALRLGESMQGQLARPERPYVDFEALRTAAGKAELDVELELGARGRVVLGELLVLFQTVAPMPPPPRPTLPPEARGKLFERVDGTFFTVLAMFLVADATGLAALSRRPIPKDDLALEDLGERWARPEPIFLKKKPEPPSEHQVAKNDRPAPSHVPSHGAPPPGGVRGMGLLGAVNHLGGPGVTDVMGMQDIGKSVADALHDAQGKSGLAGDSIAGAGPRGEGHGQAESIGEQGTEGGDRVDDGEHQDAELPVIVDLPPPIVEKGGLPPELVARFVKAHLRAISSCYERELKRDRSLHGRLEIRFVVGTRGQVTEAEAGDDELHSANVTECVLRQVRHWVLPAHPPDEVEVSYPFVFTPAG
ncbi:MAG: AgmX/PglI C-terminal domain-containing protein [Deltaproteobacteria bacterium]|nr:AgmX/PglI C-terminal domain-containing protein [Deltaproteobacteria bacterium]